MEGETLKTKIKEAGYELVTVAKKLSISPQALQNKLNARDVKVSFLQEIAKSINKSVYYLLDEMPPPAQSKHLIPLYNEVASIGGTEMIADSSAAYSTVEYIDAGDLFPSATAAIRHYGSSMVEYPSGCILFLKKVEDRRLIVWGSTNYCVETSEYRVTKSLDESDEPGIWYGYSSNLEKRPDGRPKHPVLKIPAETVRQVFMVLGHMNHETSHIHVIDRLN